MNMLRRPLLLLHLLLGAFALGVVGTELVFIPLWILCGAAALAAGCCALGWKEERGRLIGGLLLLFLCAGAIRAQAAQAVSATDISRWMEREVEVCGRLSGAPRVEEQEGERRVRYMAAVEEVECGGQRRRGSGKILIYASSSLEAPVGRHGDIVRARGKVRQIRGYWNPGQIDRAAALSRQGISACLYAGKAGAAVERREAWFLQRSVDALRARILAAMREAMPQADAAALFAMLFGGYGGIRPELLEAFTVTGIVHILSVSGSHVALLAGTLQGIGSLLRWRPAVTAVWVAAAILSYAFVSGFIPPVLRSAAMGILAFAAPALGRERDARRLLALTGLTMLFFQPLLLYDISFQLSFGATAGLLYLAPLFRRGLEGRLPAPLAVSFSVTLAAQAAVIPFLAWYFNMVSVSSLLANLLVVPLIEILIVVGLLGAALGVCLPFLQKILFVWCSLGLGFVYNVTSAVALIPGGAAQLPSGGAAAGGAYYALLGFCCCGGGQKALRRLFSNRPAAMVCAAAAAFAALLYFYAPAPLQVHFIDVGQGDAALILTPHGKAVLIDAGGSLRGDFDVGERVVVPYLRHYGVRGVDTLFLTHAHADHAGGAAAVCRRFAVGKVMIGHEARTQYARAFAAPLTKLPLCIPACAGERWRLDGVDFEVLYAAEPPDARSGNETSNVVRVSYGAQSFLFTGDLDAAGEKALVAQGAALQSTVLKVAHHGSKTSSAALFLAAVKPRYAVISVGAGNAFGHPAPEVIARLQAAERIYRTDLDGAVVCRTDGRDLWVKTFKESGGIGDISRGNGANTSGRISFSVFDHGRGNVFGGSAGKGAGGEIAAQ